MWERIEGIHTKSQHDWESYWTGTDLTAVEGLIDHVAPRLVTNADLNTFDLATLETIVKRHMNDCMTARNSTEDFGYSGDC